VLNVSGAALIKMEIPGHNLSDFAGYVHFFMTWRVICGFVIIFLSALVMFKALSVGRFTYIIPIATGINFSLTVFLGVFLFGDRLNVYSWLGLSFIFSGILLMSLTKAL
jgi:uncharacterized membrane protein